MTWGIIGAGAVFVLLLLWFLVRQARHSGRKEAENDAMEDVIGDIAEVKKARDSLDDAERDKLRKRHTRP